jgi:1-acyl-sn-glycerol-3-phosphate acyltransferase
MDDDPDPGHSKSSDRRIGGSMGRETGRLQQSNGNGNGHGDAQAARRAAEQAIAERDGAGAPAWLVGAGEMAGDALSLPAKIGGRVGRMIAGRIPAADLDERDPDYIRESLPRLWLLASLYYRGEVRGLGNIPEEGGVLMVGNHSGGNLTPDTGVLTLAFCSYFGVERPFYQLAHNLVLSMPGLSFLRKFGTVAAGHKNAKKALDAGAAVLVYPGGDYEVHRPIWERHRVDFDGRKGFIKLALDQDVPIVPVVSIGGQETSIFLSRGEGLAKLLRLDKTFRLKVLPISLALPWGINVGDMLGHWPLPAKIVVEALPPIHLREEFGEDPDIDEVYDHIVRLMQDTLDALAAERRLPLLG